MKLLAYSDWKQRIAFDNIIYKDVKRFSLVLNSAEREIMDTQIDYYRHNFSILQVMKFFKTLKTKKEKESFIKIVVKKIENIMYLPYMLKPYFVKKIKDEFSDYSAFFNLLLENALNKSSHNPIIHLYKEILGRYYKKVIKRVKRKSKEKEIKVIQTILSPASYENKARQLIGDLQHSLNFANTYGRSAIRKTVPISIVNEYGYGEWKSKNISYGANRFFIYSNNNKLTDKQLDHMVYFNVYPGYAHFYNTVVDINNDIAVDTGATFLINGWAMYSMCHSINNAYSNTRLIEGSIITNHLLKKNLEKSYENIYVYLLGKYTKKQTIEYMLDYSQYPGHYLSYILGAFAIDECINQGFGNTPKDFLESLSEINCGDFFALYHPKEQRKLALNNITAKVVGKLI